MKFRPFFALMGLSMPAAVAVVAIVTAVVVLQFPQTAEVAATWPVVAATRPVVVIVA